MNILPYEEDYKWAKFRSFQATEELMPSTKEVEAVGRFIDTHLLDKGGARLLQSCETPSYRGKVDCRAP